MRKRYEQRHGDAARHVITHRERREANEWQLRGAQVTHCLLQRILSPPPGQQLEHSHREATRFVGVIEPALAGSVVMFVRVRATFRSISHAPVE
jgi:hypothetical protein